MQFPTPWHKKQLPLEDGVNPKLQVWHDVVVRHKEQLDTEQL
jgi:hypothetical protein